MADDLTDGLADAIIGAVFLARVVSSTATGTPKPRFRKPGVVDLTPKTDEVFEAPADYQPPRVKTREEMQQSRNRYLGSADAYDRDTKRTARNIAEAAREDEEWTN